MAKKSSPITWVALTIGGLFLFNWLVKSFSNSLKFGTIKMKVKGFTTSFGILLNVTVPITNGSPVSISVDDFQGAIWYGPVKIADIDQLQPIILTANAITNYVVEADVETTNLAKEIKDQLLNGNYLQAFFLKGKMKVGSLNIPINEQITAFSDG